MNDLIDRQAAICIASVYCHPANIAKELAKLPSAQPERIRGRWYKLTGMMPPEYMGVYFCSNCNEPATRDWKHHKQTRTAFCPNCGADMRDKEDQDGQN